MGSIHARVSGLASRPMRLGHHKVAAPHPRPPPSLGAAPPADARGKFDELVEQDGVRILIDPAALMHVLGTKMDFIEDPLRWGGRGALPAWCAAEGGERGGD